MKAVFWGSNALVWNVLRTVLLIFIAAVGLFYGTLYDAVLVTDELDYTPARMESVIHGLALLVVFMVNYVPSFRPRSEYLSRLYPVSQRFRTGINFFGDMLNLTYVYSVVFIAMMVVGGNQFGLLQGFNSALFLVLVIVLERNVKVLLEQFMPKLLWYAGFIAVLGGIVLLYLGFGLELESYRVPAQTALFFALTAISVVLYFHISYVAGPKRERIRIRSKKAVRKSYRNMSSFSTAFYFRRKSTLFAVVMIFASKIFLIAYAYFILSGNRNSEFGMYYVITLLLPIIPFSYVHNNFAGFFRESWFAAVLQSGDTKILLRTWLGTLLPVLSLDLVLGLGVIWYMGYLGFDIIVFIVLVLCLFVPVGIIASLHHPRYIERLFSMQNISNFRNNSSGLYMFYFLIIMVSLLILYHFGLIYFAVIPVLLLSISLILYIPHLYNTMRYNLYQRLYHDE